MEADDKSACKFFMLLKWYKLMVKETRKALLN
jgi:hypothetical protein